MIVRVAHSATGAHNLVGARGPVVPEYHGGSLGY